MGMKISKPVTGLVFIFSFTAIFYSQYLIWRHYWVESLYNKAKRITIPEISDERIIHQQRIVRQLDRIIKINPLNSRYYFEIAEIFLKSGSYLLAKDKYIKAIALEPMNALYYLRLGLAYNYLGETNTAEEEFLKALKLDPTSAYIHFVIGDFYLSWGQKEKSYSYFRESIQLSDRYEKEILDKIFQASNQYPELKKVMPPDSKRKLILVEFLDEKNLWDEVKSEFWEIIGLRPNLSYYQQFSTLIFKREDFKEAIKIWQDYLKIDPKYVRAYINMAYAYRGLGQFELAIESCKKIIQLEPENKEAYLLEGDSYFEIKDYDNAFGNYQKALSLDFRNAWANVGLGKVFWRKQDLYKAIDYYNKAIELAPDNIGYRSGLGALYLGVRLYEEAIREFNRCLEIDSHHYWALKGLGYAYEALNDLENARIYYERLLKGFPEDGEIKKALKNIEEKITK